MIKMGLIIVLTVIVSACNKAPVIDEGEKEWLKNHPDLSIGISPNQPPYQFIDDNSEISGMFIDFLGVIEDRLDYKFKKIYQSDWTRLLSDSKEGRIDIILQIQETGERKEYLNFTRSLLSHKHVIVVKKSLIDITSIADLRNNKIAVADSYAIQEYLLTNYPDYSIISLSDNVTGLRAVSTGQVDAFITQQAVATYYIETEGISNLKIGGEIDYPNELGIASRKNLDTLNTILSKTVNSITIAEKQNIYTKWLSYEVKPFFSKAKFWIIILFAILGVLTFVILFNIALRKRVKQKTKELTDSKEKIAENEQRYRSLMLNLETGIVVHAPDTSILIYNTKASELLGINAGQMKGKASIDPAWSFVTESNTPLPLEEYPVNRILSTRKPIKNQLLGIRQSGNPDMFWVLANGFPEMNDKGEIIEIIISLFDITERKQVEVALHESEERFRKAFAEAPMGIAMASLTSGKLLSSNKALSKMLGFTEEEFQELTFNDFTHPNDRATDMGAVQDLIEGRIQTHVAEKRYIHKNGGIIWGLRALTKISSTGDNPEYALAIIKDVTDKKHADEAIKSQLDELQSWHTLTVGRESRVMEIKLEVNELLIRLGEPIRYPN